MIFFDIDDTLVDNQAAERAAAREFQNLHGDVFPVSPDGFVALWQATTRKHMPRYLSGELSFQGQRRERMKDIFAPVRSLSDSEADDLFAVYLGSYERNWQLFPDVLPCLDRLSHFPLGIISNGESYQQRRKLEMLGLMGRISVVAISEEAGYQKPDTRIFLTACRQARVDPHRCWHIGDDLKADVKGSCAAGLRGVWLDRIADCGNCAGRDCLRISSLAALPALIG